MFWTPWLREPMRTTNGGASEEIGDGDRVMLEVGRLGAT